MTLAVPQAVEHGERRAPGVYCARDPGHRVIYCDRCKRIWCEDCGESHPREQSNG